MTHREFYAGLDFDLTKMTASGGHSNAVGLRLCDDAVSRPSRFGIGIALNPSGTTSCTRMVVEIS